MAQNIEDFFEAKARGGEGAFAIAFALMKLASAQDRTATWVKHLGLADAATPLGAIEALMVQLKETGETLAGAIVEAGATE